MSKVPSFDVLSGYGEWLNLIRGSANSPNDPKLELVSLRTVYITVAEVLGISASHLCKPVGIVAKDTKGKIWFVPETYEAGGLNNRWEIRPGTKLRLRVSKVAAITHSSAAFPSRASA